MWYCDFPFPSDPAFTNDAHSRHPHRGVFTQLLFHRWDLLYRHLFPGEILTNPAMCIHQFGGLTSWPLYQAVDGMSPFAAGIASLPYSLGSTLISIPAAWFMGFWQVKRGNMSGQKWISFTGLIIGAAGFGASISKFYSQRRFDVWGTRSTPSPDDHVGRAIE